MNIKEHFDKEITTYTEYLDSLKFDRVLSSTLPSNIYNIINADFLHIFFDKPTSTWHIHLSQYTDDMKRKDFQWALSLIKTLKSLGFNVNRQFFMPTFAFYSDMGFSFEPIRAYYECSILLPNNDKVQLDIFGIDIPLWYFFKCLIKNKT